MKNLQTRQFLTNRAARKPRDWRIRKNYVRRSLTYDGSWTGAMLARP